MQNVTHDDTGAEIPHLVLPEEATAIERERCARFVESFADIATMSQEVQLNNANAKVVISGAVDVEKTLYRLAAGIRRGN